MRDFIFFTNRKITAQECFEAIKIEMPTADKGDGTTSIFVGGKNRAYLWFSNDRISDCWEEEIKAFKGKVPMDNAYLVNFETYRSIEAKKMIKALLRVYPELYVNVQDDDWWGTAQEYLDTEFDY